MPVPEKKAGASHRPPDARRPMPRWKKVLLATAAFALVAGAGFRVYSLARGQGDGQKVVTDQRNLTTGLRNEGGQPFFPDGPRERSVDEGAEGSASTWSPLLLKGGFSFIAGFAIGFALRAFFKISAVVLGLVLLAIFGLQYAGVLNVDWHSLEAHFNRIVGSVTGEASGFKDFIAQKLPAASLAGLGLFTGFKKN
jgi:uncharacterized membrane protein (Fun14 family)